MNRLPLLFGLILTATPRRPKARGYTRPERWWESAGFTAFAPFPDTTGYFGPRDRMWMINLRVRDLNAMVAQLRASGIKVKPDPETYPNGRFAGSKTRKATESSCGSPGIPEHRVIPGEYSAGPVDFGVARSTPP